MGLLFANKRMSRLRMMAGAGCAALALAATPVAALTQSAVASFDIRPAPLSQSLLEFGRQAGISISADQELTNGVRGRSVSGNLSVENALEQLLEGTGLKAQFHGPNTVRLVRSGQGDDLGNDLQAHGNQEATAVADIIVTAQKREQSIRDVPIAVTALSADTLDSMKIEGGSELLRAIPNVAFSKSNFSMYNFSIRGIGTKAISAASDPAVAISFNNSPTIRNRLFESEYMDVSRVEVLRGPQGTLYGRNATAGVVNMLPNLPGPDFEAMARIETGNYSTLRGQMMINIPLSETFWVRAAGSLTQRDGFDFNTHTQEAVNGRDLWSGRLSAAWEPSDRFRANLIWEHFEEDDDRSRTGKQLCTRDPGPEKIGSITLTEPIHRGRLSQGCLPRSLYSDSAYQTPNAIGMSQLFLLNSISYGLDGPSWDAKFFSAADLGVDPYLNVVQSKNLREISTTYNPIYRAKNDIAQLNLEFDLSDKHSFVSQTFYTQDSFWSTQDYARYLSNDIFNDSSFAYNVMYEPITSPATPGGYFDDPQLGRSRGMVSADLSSSENNQFYQEFRFQKNSDDAFNYSIGANYLEFETEDNYYVFNNTFSYLAKYFYNQDPNSADFSIQSLDCVDGSVVECVYIDNSPISALVGDGHNYFRSLNKVTTKSWAVFGESYLKLADNKNLTIGLRYTEDKKTTTPYPSQLLLGTWDFTGWGFLTGGKVNRGYYALPDVEQSWSAVTGRAVFDWKPNESTMVYASYSRGYKGGGTNPPRADLNTEVVQYQPLAETFDPEYVNAFEVGSKFQSRDGRYSLNVTAFHYDYTDYQVSQIVDRISLNENFDSTSTGIEFESVWRPTQSFKMDATLGFMRTRIADGEKSIDVMNRTQGNEDWMVLRPWLQVPSNCIAPRAIVEQIFNSPRGVALMPNTLSALCGGAIRWGSYHPDFPSNLQYWRLLGITYNPLTDAPNGGRGFDADLSGNELPNAPRWTANIGAQYTWMVGGGDLTLRGDYYRQGDSFFRVYNTEYDELRGWDNLNIAVTWESPARDLIVQAYVKNVFDDAPIVDAFTNSDDSMLTTNVFTLDPRVWGVSLTKRF